MLVVTLFSPPVVHRTLGFIFWWSRSHWYRKMVPWEASYEGEFCGQWGHINPWNGYQREDSFKKRRDTTKLKAYSSALSWCPSERDKSEDTMVLSFLLRPGASVLNGESGAEQGSDGARVSFLALLGWHSALPTVIRGEEGLHRAREALLKYLRTGLSSHKAYRGEGKWHCRCLLCISFNKEPSGELLPTPHRLGTSVAACKLMKDSDNSP